jgi:hypothetical protein
MTTYEGHAKDHYVTADGKNLDPRHDLRNHSPDGFSWGYEGSGPSQLALAILAHHYDDDFAQENYQHFKRDIIAGIPQNKEWLFDGALIDQWALDNELLPEPPVPDVRDISNALYRASQALKVAGQKMSARIEHESKEAGYDSARHPRSRDLAMMLVVSRRVQDMLENLDLALVETTDGNRCGSCNEFILNGPPIPYRLQIEGEWVTADICRTCFDRFKGEGPR